MVYLALFLFGISIALGRVVWNQRRTISALKEKRKEIVVEEHRMFSFLHGLGEALQVSRTQAEFHEFILHGAQRVVEATHGALYLLDANGTTLVPRALSPACPPLTPDLVPAYSPAKPAESRSAIQLRPIPLEETNTLLGHCLAQHRGLHLNDLSSHQAFASLPQAEREKLRFTAMLALLQFGGSSLGVLVVLSGSKRFDANDFAVFRSLADQSSLSLGTAQLNRQAVIQRRLEEELRNAREVQRILLPAESPPLEGYRIAGNNRAARTVSGDYYDFLPLGEEHLGVAIADVSGKGLPASLMMAMGRSVLRANAEPWFSPSKALAIVNRILFPDMRQDMFISMIYLIASKKGGEVVMARAGHDPPLLFRAANGSVEMPTPSGLAVGIDEGPVFERRTQDYKMTLESGDCLLLYTDGISEAQNAEGEEFGMERLEATFQEAAPRGAREIERCLDEKIAQFVGDCPQTDDMTLVVLEKT